MCVAACLRVRGSMTWACCSVGSALTRLTGAAAVSDGETVAHTVRFAGLAWGASPPLRPLREQACAKPLAAKDAGTCRSRQYRWLKMLQPWIAVVPGGT